MWPTDIFAFINKFYAINGVKLKLNVQSNIL
jgi:hypothetical protein